MSAPTQDLPEGGLSTLVLDVDAWHVIHEVLPEVALPQAFGAEWGLLSGDDQIASAREGARRRLTDQGLLGADGRAHPSLAAALAMFTDAPLRAQSRTWSGDRAVISEIAVAGDAGVALTRIQQIDTFPGLGPHVAADAVGVELAIFPAATLLGAIWRTMPPVATDPTTPGLGPDTTDKTRVEVTDALALAAALRAFDTAETTDRDAAAEVVRVLLADAGLTSAPPELADLATSLDGAVRLTLTTATPTGQVEVQFGLWLAARGQLIGLNVSETDGTTWLDLWPTTSTGLRTDLLTACTRAFDLVTSDNSGPA